MNKEANAMGSVRVAIVGVGNCASSLVLGVEYYKNADPNDRVPGLMHVTFGDYHVSDVQFVAAFDVDAKKVGMDLAEAIVASENNTITLCDVPPTGVTVQRGPTFDGLGQYYREIIPPLTSRRGRVVYKITAEGKERFADLLAQAGPETYEDAGFGVHFAFFARTDRATRLRILEGRRRRIEERREGLRDVLARASDRLDAYTLELQRHGLEACEREVRWLEELITNERSGRTPSGETPPSDPAPPLERP